MNKFIFLDIDGVLNSHAFDAVAMSNLIDRDKVQRLNRILAETGAFVVLSSAWRYIVHRGESSLAGMDWLLRSHGFMAGRLVGITRADTMMPASFDGTPGTWPVENERGRQISEWIVCEGWKHYGEAGRHVVLDDLDLGISGCHPFVQTDGKVGLTEADADRAIAILNGTAPFGESPMPIDES